MNEKLLVDLLPEERENAAEWLKYYAVPCPVKCIIGEWIVSEEGDIVHSSEKCSHYPILLDSLQKFTDAELINHISKKIWFVEREPDIRITLLDALDEARRIMQEHDK